MARPNRPQLALLRGKRGPEVLENWTKEFGEGDPELAGRYALAVATFLGREPAVEGEFEAFIGTFSPRTRRAYAYAITEFFEWLASEHARIVPPHSVTTLDAERYVGWLSDRTYSLESERLRDGDEPERLAIFETVEQLGSADITSIAPLLPKWMKETYPRSPTDKNNINLAWLNKELGRMVLHDLLVRTPTMEELRRENPRLGIDVFTVMVPEGTRARQVAIESIFQYSVPKPKAVGRTTIALRLTALSSFWDVLSHGENIAGGGSILKYNVFKQIKKRVLRGLAAEKKEAAARANQLTSEIVEKLLAAADGPTLADKRNAALLWFLVLTGARVSEAVAIRRGKPPAAEENRWPGWLDPTTEPVGVWLRRKGNKLQWLPFPPYALRALHAFQTDLDGRKPKAGAQPFDSDAPGYVQPDSPKWRYQQLAEQDDAPLFPPVSFWGANSTWNYQEFKPNIPATRGGTSYTRPMTRHGVEKLLKRIAKRADLSIEDQAKVHAHSIRHFAATAMIQQGKPIREVQAILGHESITTTEKYIAEEKRPVALSGQNEILDYLAGDRPPEAVQPPVPRQPRAAIPREIIQTYAVPAEEVERPRKPRKPKPKKKPRPRVKPEEEWTPEEIEDLMNQVGPEEAQLILAGKKPRPPTEEEIAEEIEEAVQAVSDKPAPEDIPAQSPVIDKPKIIEHETSEGPLAEIAGEAVPVAATEIRDGLSPGSPVDVYAALEPTPNLSTEDRIARQEPVNFTVTEPRPAREGEVRAGVVRGRRPRKPKGAPAQIDPTIYVKPDGTQMVQAKELKDTRGRVTGINFLWEHYRQWPRFYGIGRESLLPWFAPRPGKNGEKEVTVIDPETGKREKIRVPALPVLAPDQVYPETVESRVLFDGLERLTREWYSTAPSKVFGLRRWFAAFAQMTSDFERRTHKRIDPRNPLGDPVLKDGVPVRMYEWVPFDGLAKLGRDIRAHDDQYLVDWFEQNSGRYSATVKGYKERIPRGEKYEDVAFLEKFQEATVAAPVVESIPDWFADPDPIHAIYERDPEEWDEFVKWIGAITGVQMSKTREDDRDEQKEYASQQMNAEAQQAQGILEVYFTYTTEVQKQQKLGQSTVDSKKSVAAALEQLSDMGVDPRISPSTGKKFPSGYRNDKRIKELIAAYYPQAEVKLASPNILQSGVFDADAFRIDRRAKTITHTDEFRERFAQRYDERDSECLMRRAARAMWEYVKRTREKGRAPEHSMIYATMLAYIAWIFPCPEDIELAMAEHRGDLPPEEARAEWLVNFNRKLRGMLTDKDEEADLPDGHERIVAATGATLMAGDVERAGIAPVEAALREALATGAMEIEGSRGGLKKRKEEEETDPGKLRIAKGLLAVEETRKLSDEEIAKRSGVHPDVVADLRTKVFLVKKIKPEEVFKEAVVTRGGRTIVLAEPHEQATTYFGGVETEEELKKNGRARVLLSPNMYRRGLAYLANAERVLPSPLRMIAAMTISY
jgi:site-specific recombinase XerD